MSYPPTTLEEAFDFSTPYVLEWEIAYIRNAALSKRIRVSSHARSAALDDGCTSQDLLDAVLNGIAISKDMPGNALGRQAGINFEHTIMPGKCIRVKVMWGDGYWYVTMHTVEGGG